MICLCYGSASSADLGNDTVEGGALKVQGLASLANALLAWRQGTGVQPGSAWELSQAHSLGQRSPAASSKPGLQGKDWYAICHIALCLSGCNKCLPQSQPVLRALHSPVHRALKFSAARKQSQTFSHSYQL